MNSNSAKFGIAIVLIVLVALSRLLPHPDNFTPVAAIALFSGVYLERRFAFIIPILALLASDYFIGFYSGMYWVYGSFILVGLIGLWLKHHKKPLFIFGGALTSSILFFIVTNFGVWASGTMYPKDVAGLVECYGAAVPFFRNTVTGDLVFVAVMFGLYEASLAIAKRMTETKPTVIG
jgi:Family of unknown function (DUF6580)